MSKIDTKNRKEFRVGDFFDAKRGKSLQLQKINEGEIPVIAAAGYNQGIAGYYDVVAEYENRITVSCNGVGCGSTFYHDYPFAINGDAIVLLEKINISDYSKKFITSVLHKLLSNKYSYEEKCSGDKAKQEIILLPTDNFGNPDREYMENYMKNLEEKCKKELELLKKGKETEKGKIDTNLWKEFKVGDLFDIHPTKAYKDTNKDLFDDDGINPVIVNSGFNNGIGGYTNKDCTEKAGTITFTDTAAKSSESFFYQDKDFVGYSHVQGMYSKGHQWNKLESLFLTTSIKAAIKGRYDFIKKMTRDEILKLTIKLPVDSEGNPNREFMEKYIKNIESKCKINFSNLKN